MQYIYNFQGNNYTIDIIVLMETKYSLNIYKS